MRYFEREARMAGALFIGVAVVVVPPAALVLAANAGMGLSYWLGLGWACMGEAGASVMAGFLILNWLRHREADRASIL